MGKLSSEEWQEFIEGCSSPHILQSRPWGELKSSFGWTPSWFVEGDLGAQVLIQNLPLGFKVAYIPRGPVSASVPVIDHPDWPAFLQELDTFCKDQRVVFLKLEPDLWEEDLADHFLPFPGFEFSPHSIQPVSYTHLTLPTN